jgi:uncharacterized protein YjhX (UPF0386 family)
MITVHDIEQGTPEWLELRAGKYTGSNAHKLLRFGAIEYSRTEQGSFGGNFYTRRGHVLEDEALALYERIYKTQVDRPGFITNSEYPTCGYSPDGLDGLILLECKAFNPAKHMKIIKEGPPFEIEAQIHFGLTLTELKQARLILYNPDLEPKYALHIIEIKANRNIKNNFRRYILPQPVGI